MQLGSVGKFLMVQLHLWKIGTEVWEEVINLVKVNDGRHFKESPQKHKIPGKKKKLSPHLQNRIAQLIGTYRF